MVWSVTRPLVLLARSLRVRQVWGAATRVASDIVCERCSSDGEISGYLQAWIRAIHMDFIAVIQPGLAGLMPIQEQLVGSLR
jgi:hypothetical protein